MVHVCVSWWVCDSAIVVHVCGVYVCGSAMMARGQWPLTSLLNTCSKKYLHARDTRTQHTYTRRHTVYHTHTYTHTHKRMCTHTHTHTRHDTTYTRTNTHMHTHHSTRHTHTHAHTHTSYFYFHATWSDLSHITSHHTLTSHHITSLYCIHRRAEPAEQAGSMEHAKSPSQASLRHARLAADTLIKTISTRTHKF